MNQSCTQCSASYEITQSDLEFYEKVSPVFGGKKYLIPSPTLCPDCRVQRRFSFRNERTLYHRKCDLTGKQLVSVYSPDKPYTVYEPAVWWSDAYDPLTYGRECDFSRPFFEQFDELNRVVPKSAIQNAKSENCEYTNYSAENKNCYLVVGALGSEDCLYSDRAFYSSDLVDCFDLFKSELCYECSECSNLHVCTHCHNCHNCSDCFLCDNCTGCQNCFGCANLRNKQFYIYNTPFSDEEYRRKITELRQMRDPAVMRDIKALHLSVPHRHAVMVHCDNCSGDQQLECRNCKDCYIWKHSQDCRFCAVGENDRDCYDANFCDNCELQYESSNLEKNYRVLFGMLVWYCKDSLYCMNSFNSNNLFGCSGMKKHEYCILNKQYTKEEYDALVPKIIAHMKSTGEWGEFFPMGLSPFGYNESIAQGHVTLTRAEAIAKGLTWHEEEEVKQHYLGPDTAIPAAIGDVSDEILKQILTCSVTGKPFKIIPQELKFYRRMGIPIPQKCPDQRYRERMALQNPRKLWKRQCAKCQKEIETTYNPERPEIVYCESCYLSSVY